MVSKVGFDLGVQGTWFREYGVHGFESTSYMVSAVLAYRVYSFSLPIHQTEPGISLENVGKVQTEIGSQHSDFTDTVSVSLTHWYC